MANEMPDASAYSGLSRKVVEYSAAFTALVNTAKQRPLTDADWQALESLVDVDRFERLGVFLGAEAERFGWATYKEYIAKYGTGTDWEGTLRQVTETPGRVILELEERNIREGVTHVSNTVTIYDFTDDGRVHHLDVYVMPLGER